MSTEKSPEKSGNPAPLVGRFLDAPVEVEAPSSPVNPKLEIMLRKEKQFLQEEAQYTFKPTLNKPRKVSDKEKPDENRFDRLYSDALKRHLESKWKESAGDKDLTFKPKISARGNSSRSSSRERGSIAPPSTEAIVNRLFSPKPKATSGEEFSFKPSITKRAMSIDRSLQRDTPERLYQHSKVAKEKQEKLKQEFDLREKEDCTFAPRIVTTAKSAQKTALELTARMDKYEEMKTRKREEAQRLKLEAEGEGLTFTPQIKLTKRSATPTKSSVYERLASGPASGVERDLSASHSEIDAHLTFKPQLISKRSASPSPSRSAGHADYRDVHLRLFEEGQQRLRDKEAERQLIKEETESQLTFTPVINTRSRDVSDKHHAAAHEGPVFQRLSTTSSRQHMQEMLSKIKTDLEMKDCTFKPKLLTEPKFSPKESDTEPIYVRLAQEGERVKAEHQRMHEKQLADDLKEATFSPLIPERSASIARRRSTVHVSIDGTVVQGESVHDRLSHTPTANSHAVLTPPHEGEVKKVLARQDLDRVFRRLSITTTESLGQLAPAAAADESASVSVQDGPASSTPAKRLTLPEGDVNKIFLRLSAKRTESSERMVLEDTPEKAPVKVKTLPENSLDKVFRRLSMTSAPPAADLADTSTVRDAARPASSSPMAGAKATTPLGKSSGSASKPHSSVPRAPKASEAAPSTPAPSSAIVQRTPKVTGSSSGANVLFATPASVALTPATPAAKTPPPAEPVRAVAAAAESLPAPPVSVAAPKPVAVPPTPPPPPAAAKPTHKAQSSSGGGGDMFSKLEASLSFLEQQLDTKGSFVARKPAPSAAASVFAAVVDPVPAPASAEAAPAKTSPKPVASEGEASPKLSSAEKLASKLLGSSPTNGSFRTNGAPATSAATNGGSFSRGAPATGPKRVGSKDRVAEPSAAGSSKVMKGRKKTAEPPARPADESAAFIAALPAVEADGDSDPEEH